MGSATLGVHVNLVTEFVMTCSQSKRMHLQVSQYHRRLQSCVGTRARLGYATFDAQLRKAYFVTTLYAIHTSVRA